MRLFIIFGVFIISLVFPRRDCLKQAETDALGRISSKPLTQDSTLSKSEHFLIHYDLTGSAAPDLQDLDPANGVPDYIDEVGIIADSARHVLVNMMGFAAPPADEDSIYDIYINIIIKILHSYKAKNISSLRHHTS